MATLEKIRSNGVLILIVIGFAMIAFIIGDFLNSSTSLFSDQNKDVAVINGEGVKIDEYSGLMDQLNTVYKIEYGENAINDQVQDQIQEMVWDHLVINQVMSDEAASLGLQVPSSELKDLIVGNRISPLVYQRRIFADQETGNFNPAQVREFIRYIDSDEVYNYGEEGQRLKQYWMFWEKMVKNNRLQEKYVALLGKALVINNLQAEQVFADNNESATIVYAMKSYFSIADSTIKVTENEIKALYNKKKEQFKQEASVDIQYVAFPITPSQEDFEVASTWINGLQEEFSTTDEIALFTNTNSDITYRAVNETKEDVDSDFAEFAFSGQQGEVMGPIFSNNTYKMARIVENGISLPDSVKLRNIFVYTDNSDQTRILADSIENALKSGANFDALCREFSKSDNARNNGEIGWIRENTPGLDKEIIAKGFTTAANGYFQIPMGNGINIFQVQELGEKVSKVKLAVVSREVIPSSATQAKLYNEAKQFAAENTNTAAVETASREKNLPYYQATNLNANTAKVNNIKNTRQIVRWAFDNNANSVSDVFETEGQYIIATVTKVNKKGYRPMDEVKDALIREIRNEKKGEQITAQMTGKSLAQLRAENFSIDTVANINYNSPYAGSLGNEPAICALATVVKENTLSKPIAGNMCAFVFETIAKENTGRPYNQKEEIAMLETRQQYSLYGALIEALRTSAVIEDNRSLFY